MRNLLPIGFIILVISLFFWQLLFKGYLPIPSDSLVGLYHPFRDFYAKDYPRGMPFKNFLITDPVRQQYPWKVLVHESEKKLQLPLWNPYNGAGEPLLANIQSASFYPFNLMSFMLPFPVFWSVFIMLGPLLGALFLYVYLRNIHITAFGSSLGALVFAFCGFSVAWLEWGTIGHTVLWLPLILLSIDKIVSSSKYQVVSIRSKKLLIWCFIFLFSFASSFFAGHLQIFFYLFLFSTVYFLARWIQTGRRKEVFFLFLILNSLFIILSSIQWIPTLRFILESSRDIDQVYLQKEGWFIPWQHLIQFIVPDFFGNPTTLNYWGTWNYGELIGYVGIVPFIFALYSLFFRHDKKTLFYGIVFFLSLIFSLPTIFAEIPYRINIPFLATAQPTRLLFLTDFSLAVLAAFGMDYFLRRKKEIIYPLIALTFIFMGLWVFALWVSPLLNFTDLLNMEIAKRNLILPTVIFVFAVLLFVLSVLWSKVNKNVKIALCILLIGLTAFDLLRFADKFTPFTQKNYLFPATSALSFLQKQEKPFRIMTVDSRILPPNVSSVYHIESVDVYNPLYLKRYGELIAASERGKPDISPPFGFNRIITPHNYDTKIIDLLGVKYIVSLTDIENQKLKKVFQEGETRVYENSNALSRAFFVKRIHEIRYENRQEAIKIVMDKETSLREVAVVEFELPKNMVIKRAPFGEQSIGQIKTIQYKENSVVIQIENEGDGFLVLTDTYYPTWKVTIDGKEGRIYKTDYNFRGVFVPKGQHVIRFFNTLF